MKKLYPLKLKPIPKNKIWGGDNFLKKNYTDNNSSDAIKEDSPLGELLGLYDFNGESSIVENGFLAENELSDLLETYLGDLVGDNIFDFYQLQFPVFLKILEIKDNISVQVHPNDEIAFERYDSYGKQEFWYVLDSTPESKVYIGFKKDVTVSEFYEACQNGSVIDLMNAYTPKKGDCFLIQPGIVHAAGGGLLLAEVSQPSDFTMRLYDWGRENTHDARVMSLEESLDCINYQQSNSSYYHVATAETKGELVATDNFIVKKIQLSAPLTVNIDDFNGFVAYFVVEGECEILSQDTRVVLKSFETILVPSKLDEITIVPKSKEVVLLGVSVGEKKEPEDTYINE